MKSNLKHLFQGTLSLLVFSLGLTHPLRAEEPITVKSDTLSLNRSEDQDVFHFTGNVHVLSTDMEATCDTMEIFSERQAGPQTTSFGNIELIIAQGSVIIQKPDQTVKAGRAEIIPSEEKMVLCDNPSIINKDGIIEGFRITLFQNDQKAIVEGSPTGERPTVTLPDKLAIAESFSQDKS